MSNPDSALGAVGATHATRWQEPADARPIYRVAAFGLAHKFRRLTEIVLRHAHHNRYRFVVAATSVSDEYDIALVDMTLQGGPEVAQTLCRLHGERPVVRVGRRSDSIRGRDDLLQQGFTTALLETLNRVVEQALLSAYVMPRPQDDSPMLVDDDGVRRWPRALVVDDSPTVRRQLALVLQGLGVDAEGVGSAREALDALSRQRYELAFVDVMMPEVDGFSLARSMRRDKALCKIPVIILTSRSSPLDLIRGALTGCSSYLVKPVSLQSLRLTVLRLLPTAPPRRGTAQATKPGGNLSAA